MNIIPGLLTDKEFRYFKPEDYLALGKLLNDVSAGYLKTYIDNPRADPYVVDCIQQFLGATIESLTFHFVLQEKGITDLVAHITPESLVGGNVDLDDAYEKLKFLEDNVDKLRMAIPVRSKDDWLEFRECMERLVERMAVESESPTYHNMLELLDDNKFIFYKPNEKQHSTKSGIIASKRRQWTMCLRGIEFLQHCSRNGVQVLNRRVF